MQEQGYRQLTVLGGGQRVQADSMPVHQGCKRKGLLLYQPQDADSPPLNEASLLRLRDELVRGFPHGHIFCREVEHLRSAVRRVPSISEQSVRVLTCLWKQLEGRTRASAVHAATSVTAMFGSHIEVLAGAWGAVGTQRSNRDPRAGAVS